MIACIHNRSENPLPELDVFLFIGDSNQNGADVEPAGY